MISKLSNAAPELSILRINTEDRIFSLIIGHFQGFSTVEIEVDAIVESGGKRRIKGKEKRAFGEQ